MQDGLEDLLHEPAVTHRFADFLEEYCKEQERSQRYIDASGEFFRYAENLGRGIKARIAEDTNRATRFPAKIARTRIATLQRNIRTLKAYLRLIHTLIKPAADAHTLTIPAPLITLACSQLHEIRGMEGSKVVVLLTPQLMYFQRPHTHVKRHATSVGMFIPNAVFPDRLGFIELPYSQGPSLFTNLAIYHEIGHFVYEELSTAALRNPAFARLESAMSDCLARFQSDPETLALAEEIIESWTQEIFCDLFALRLVGPAFSFALVEILAMLGSLSTEATVTFNLEHPSPACRFAEHVRLLRTDGWWNAISYINPEQKSLLERLAAISRRHYTVSTDDDDGPKGLLAPFLAVVIPAIRSLARAVTPDSVPVAERFRRERKVIEECLRVGVVPHSINGGALSPVSVINSAFAFYLTSFPSIIAKFEGTKARTDVSIRSKWTKKLEDWTMKSIEDCQIRAQFEATQRNGPSKGRDHSTNGIEGKQA